VYHRTIAIVTLAALTAGCTGPGSPNRTGQGGFAQAAPGHPQQAYGMQTAATPTWSERMLATLPGNPFASSAPQSAPGVTSNQQQKLDPLSLNYHAQPPSPELFVSLAQVSEQRGEVAQARELYGKALSANPAHLDAKLGLARLEDRAGNLELALQLYHQAVESAPQSATALNDLALCYARKGELNRSLTLLDRATRLVPEQPLYRNNIAKVLVELNLLEDALRHQLAVQPAAVASYNVGVLLQDRGRDAEAAHFLHQALKVDPTMEMARVRIGQLAGGPSATPSPGGTAATPAVVPHVASNRAHAPSPGVTGQNSAANPSAWEAAQQGRPGSAGVPTRAATQGAQPTPADKPADNDPLLLPPVG
jgi:tetratricopeptide (TPR) repeat protein